jgi:hypothetical protein
VRTKDTDLASLPEDNETLKAMLRSLLLERDQQTKRAKDLHVENLRLQVERYRKLYYGPRADRLRSTGDLAQVLLDFAEELEHKSIHADDVPQQVQPEYELRRVKRRKGRRALANFENLPVTTKVKVRKSGRARAAGFRDFAGHTVGLVRRCGRSGRAVVSANGGAGAGVAFGSHR